MTARAGTPLQSGNKGKKGWDRVPALSFWGGPNARPGQGKRTLCQGKPRRTGGSRCPESSSGLRLWPE
ncbi:MAG: hypothetical protein ACE5Q6_24135 [Dehalococcoidia bacterium]